MLDVGFMQGRLSPKPADRIQAFPKDSWREEFSHAQKLGFKCIELIHDVLYYDQNPLTSDSGRRELIQLSQQSSVRFNSICADYFMVRLLLAEDHTERRQNFETAVELLGISKEIGCPIIEFPFVDASSLLRMGDWSPLIDLFKDLGERAKKNGIRISIESDLPPLEFKRFISQLDGEVFGINLDMGNSASLGYDSKAECLAYGERIFNVHVKDRVVGGTTVPLTQGHAQFSRVFESLKASNYRGDFILQTAPSPDFLGVANEYRRMVENWMMSSGLKAQ